MAYPSSSPPPPPPPPPPTPPPPPPAPANLLGVTDPPPTVLSFSKLFDRLRPRADTTPFHDAFLDKDGDGGGRFFVLERSKDKLGRVGILLPKGAQRATPANGNNTQDSRQKWGAGDCFLPRHTYRCDPRALWPTRPALQLCLIPLCFQHNRLFQGEPLI